MGTHMARAIPRSLLLTPLVVLAALVLLLEEWCWDVGMRLATALSRRPWLAALEARVRILPPGAALCVFVLPGLLLLPVKLLALLAIAHGHAAAGIATIVVAKIGGAAVVARLYALTLPTLLQVAWFARCHAGFMALKARCLARLRASPALRRARAAGWLAQGRQARAAAFGPAPAQPDRARAAPFHPPVAGAPALKNNQNKREHTCNPIPPPACPRRRSCPRPRRRWRRRCRRRLPRST